MNSTQKEIIDLIKDHLTKFQDLRFGQALFNLGINEFSDSNSDETKNYSIRDIHGDKDTDILKRIKGRLEQIDQNRK